MILEEQMTQGISIEQQLLPLNTIHSSEQLRTATQEFETLFIQKLLDIMQEGLGKNDILYSKQEALWRSMLHEEYAKEFTRAGGIGLSDMLYEYLAPLVLQHQEEIAPSTKVLEYYRDSREPESRVTKVL